MFPAEAGNIRSGRDAGTRHLDVPRPWAYSYRRTLNGVGTISRRKRRVRGDTVEANPKANQIVAAQPAWTPLRHVSEVTPQRSARRESRSVVPRGADAGPPASSHAPQGIEDHDARA